MRLKWLGMMTMAFGLTLTGCKDKDSGTDEVCVPGSTEGCAGGEVCELVGDEPTCVSPVTIQGRVFDLAEDVGIEGARIVALDANGAPRSSVAISDADGAYSLDIRLGRDDEGNPESVELVTLRVAAQGYQPFPKLPRPAIPIDLGTAAFDEVEGEWIVRSAATDVGLVALEGDVGLLGLITGRVELVDGFEAAVSGVLVVAEDGGVAVSTGITDGDGEFVLFNVPAGEPSVSGYAAGLNVVAESVTVPEGEEVSDVVLSASGEGLSAVTGNVEIVAATCGTETSVILVTESTLEDLLPGNDAFVRGEAPRGLRAGEVSTSFRIEGVPPGRYAVLAAFENDCLTRDPDQGIAGTELVIIDVPGDGNDVAAGNFKVTEAIEIVDPGATGMDVITEANPTFVFAKMPSIDYYELRMFDAFGDLVYEDLNIPDPAGGGPVEHIYAGPPLEDGMIYQFRVLAVALVTGDYRNATEDLLGVFLYDPTPPE
jgi:hypothetical protein